MAAKLGEIADSDPRPRPRTLESRRSPAAIGPQHERAAVGRRRVDVRFGTDDAQSVALQGKAANDGRIDGRRVRQRGTAESRGDLGPGAPAHAIRAFEDERLQARFREETPRRSTRCGRRR